MTLSSSTPNPMIAIGSLSSRGGVGFLDTRIVLVCAEEVRMHAADAIVSRKSATESRQVTRFGCRTKLQLATPAAAEGGCQGCACESFFFPLYETAKSNFRWQRLYGRTVTLACGRLAGLVGDTAEGHPGHIP